MTDKPEDTPPESDGAEDLLEAATDLIGTEELWQGQILHTGVTLGLFGVLDEEPAAASHLAAELGLDAENTYRLLRAMAHVGVLDEDEHRRFSLTPVGELFQADHPTSVQPDIRFNRSQDWLLPMLHMPAIVQEGGPTGFVREFGSEFFEYVRDNPEFGDRYTALMEFAVRDHPGQILDALAEVDFSQVSHVCDVGGGRGHLLCHVLAAYPHLQGTVLDLPAVVAEAEGGWAVELAVTDRCTFQSGDMFAEVPPADTYFLKWILHNFRDEECLDLLTTIRKAAPEEGRLFIVETPLPGPGTAHDAKRLDIAMMVQTGGRERTKAEYESLVSRAGWEFTETWVPDTGSLRVFEARR